MVTRGREIRAQDSYGPVTHDHIDILSDEYLSYITARVIAALEQEALDFGNTITLSSVSINQIDALTDIRGPTPELRWTEDDQADPAGRYRWRLDGDNFRLEHAATAAWATDFDFITVDHSNTRLLLDASHGTSWLIRAIATNMGIEIQGNSTAGSAVFRVGAEPSAPIFAVYGDNVIQFTGSTTPSFLGGLTSSAQSSISVAGTTWIMNNTANTTSNQVTILASRPSTRANNDEGYITFRSLNASGTATEVARETFIITDVTAGGEDGALLWSVRVNNALTSHLRLGSSGTALTLGAFGVTPVVRAGAYTQTYSTATRTHATPTVGADIGAFTDPPTAAEMATLRAFVNALKADHANLAQVVNSLIDDSQGYGFAS